MKIKSTLEPNFSLIDLTPLVDVILLMLIFFLVTADILPLKSLNIDPPELDLPSAALTTQLVVVMDAQNVIYVGHKKEIIDLGSYKSSLLREVKRNKKNHPGVDTTIVLSIDRSVDYGDFLRLFSLTQELGVKIRLMYNDVAH